MIIGVNKTQKTIGLQRFHKYNDVTMRRIHLFLIAIVLSVLACAGSPELPDDPRLEVFIRTMAACTRVERAYSDNPVMLEREMADIEFPPSWDGLVDSLLVAYGGRPDLWEVVYTEILDRSRSPADKP
jgi:hypothetical protein